MNENLETHLRQAAISTFEQLGFMFPLAEIEDCERPTQFETGAQVTFNGPLAGTLSVRTSDELVSVLAANMLGEDEPPSVEQQRDALGEVVNVICGNLLPCIAGSQAVFRLAAPEPAKPATDRDERPDTMACGVSILLDSGHVDIHLCVQEFIDSH